MLLNRINNRVYNSDHGLALESARNNLNIMLKYRNAFQHIRSGKKHLKTVVDLKHSLDENNDLTPKQISFINNGLIEKFWSGVSIGKNDPKLAGVTGQKHDFKKTLRY